MNDARLCRWAGWGKSEEAMSLDDRPALRGYLAERIGRLDPPKEPTALSSLPVGPSRLPSAAREALVHAVGPENLFDDHAARVLHSLGKSYRDLVRAWTGELGPVTDAVVVPPDEQAVAAVLAIAARHRFAVVPFGGGTSVVGGVDALAGSQTAVVTLDTRRLLGIALDENSCLATIGAGELGPDIERHLGARGFTLGHFPQSFEFSTLGGWIAPRGAGQQSTRFGKIEEIVQAVRIVTPRGTIETRNVPASAAGPSFLQQVVGSEGTLGVIVRATCRVHRLGQSQARWAYLTRDFAQGADLLRQWRQAELPLSVVRLSDAEETRFLRKGAGGSPSLGARLAKTVLNAALRRRGWHGDDVCLAIATVEGSPALVSAARHEARVIARGVGALSLGAGPAANWQRDRFRLPYLRDDLVARGVMVDTLETATTWSRLLPTYDAVRTALETAMRAEGAPGVAMCHLSHLYHTGSSLYFTFLAPQAADRPLAQWQHIKDAASRAIVEAGATLSHHHGLGFEHRPLSAEHGPAAVEALRAAKHALDPEGIMNPEKVYLDER